MTSPPKILCTFVGEVARDSRLLRMARSLADLYTVEILALGESDRSYHVDGIFVKEYARRDRGSLRRSLRGFRSDSRAYAGQSGASLFMASDLYSLPVAARAARRNRIPLLYDSRELYSSIAALAGRPLTQMYWSYLERRLARLSTAIITVNASIADILIAKFPSVRVVVLRNYPAWQRSFKTDALRRRLSIPDDEVIVLSQGGLQPGRGAFPLIDALGLLSGHRLVFLGSGGYRDAILNRALDRGVAERVSVITDVSADELGEYTASADVGCCLIENLGASYYASLPNKLFEYIAAGVPVVGSDFPEISRVIESEKVGVTVDPGDAKAIAKAIERLLPKGDLHMMCSANCLAAQGRYRWETEGTRLLSLVAAAIDQAASGSR
jgi:glycogen synthase